MRTEETTTRSKEKENRQKEAATSKEEINARGKNAIAARSEDTAKKINLKNRH